MLFSLQQISLLAKVITICFVFCFGILVSGCDSKKSHSVGTNKQAAELNNTQHLDYLFTPVTFKNGEKAAGIYIYAEAPDYKLTADSDEGYTCVDDVARAALVYLRHENFDSDTVLQNKAISLLHFVLQMQSPNNYFYNFLFPDGSINKTGTTSTNRADWWSWRAFQALTEAAPKIKRLNAPLYVKIEVAVKKLAGNIKADLAPLQKHTKLVKGLKVPRWLPAGSATDQSAILILGLVNYCSLYEDEVLKNYIRTLGEGILQMQLGDAKAFPFFAIMSWENVWHAYGSDQAYALMEAGRFLKDTILINGGLREVDHFYPWLLNESQLSNFSIIKKEDSIIPIIINKYEQIAYGIRPMISAAAKAYSITGNLKYADLAGELGAWFFGKNLSGMTMYDTATGRGFDGILSAAKINNNAGAESTIESLLSMQTLASDTNILEALNRYRYEQ